MENMKPTVVTPDEEERTLRGRWLGSRLKQHREAASITGAQVAKRMARTPSTITRWESGRLIPRPPDVEFMLNMYGVTGKTRERLIRLADEARERNWWEGDVAVLFADYVWLETKATKVSAFETTLIHGLLQTREYAEEVIRAEPGAGEPKVERGIKVRLARQERLTSTPPLEVSIVLDEAVLRRPIGSVDMMRSQLQHLVDLTALPNVEIRVLPFGAKTHASLHGPFSVLEFPDDEDVVYMDTRGGAIYLENATPFWLAWRDLDKKALSAKRSTAMIAEASKEM